MATTGNISRGFLLVLPPLSDTNPGETSVNGESKWKDLNSLPSEYRKLAVLSVVLNLFHIF